MSTFLTLRDAVVTALLTAPALAGGVVRGGRDVPVPDGVSQAIDVHLQRSLAAEQFLEEGLLRWDTLFGIDLYARASAGADGEAAVDALLVATFQRIGAAALPTGVLSWTLEPAVQWAVSEADQTLVQATLSLRVTHYTDRNLAAVAV